MSYIFVIESLDQKFLVLRGAIFLDFVGQYFLQVSEELVVESTRTIALLARHALLVDFLAVALEAFWEVLLVGDDLLLVDLVHLFWSEDQAAHLLRMAHRIFLASLRLRIDLGVAHHLLVFFFGHGSALRSDFVRFDDGVNMLLISVDIGGVASEAWSLGDKLLDHVPSIGGMGDHGSLADYLFIIAACDGVRLVHLLLSLSLHSLSSNLSLCLHRHLLGVLAQHF